MGKILRHPAIALLLTFGLSSAASAQDGGKLPWKGKNDDVRSAMADAHQQKRPMMLFFTSEG